MKEPIKSGDMCLVVGGLGRKKSPNIGKTVRVGLSVGDHSEYGRVWRCTGEDIKQLHDNGEYITMHWADFPAKWLEKIIPPGITPKAIKRELEDA